MSELELALVDLGRHVEFPPTPDLTPRVRARLAEKPSRARSLARGYRNRVAIALAVLAVAVGAVMAVPQTRAAILEFFRLRGVTIERVDELPTVPINEDFNKLFLGEQVTLDEARDRADFEVLLPEALGDPDGVYFQGSPPGGMVSFVYGSAEEPRALFTQFRASVENAVFKKVEAGTDIEAVTVEGQPGFYLSGEPHVFGYVDADDQFREETVRLVGNVLLWERRPLTLRLEGDLSRDEALDIARSVR
jgi:hypothetical protein